jgi:hypothetical protein
VLLATNEQGKLLPPEFQLTLGKLSRLVPDFFNADVVEDYKKLPL